MEIRLKRLKVFNELYKPLWRTFVIYGGRNSGKSYHVALALLLRGSQKKLRILCAREIQRTIRDSVHKLLSDLIADLYLVDYEIKNDSIINNATGTEFIFKGLKSNIMEIKSTEGVDVCWIEEAQSVSNESLDILTPTIRKPGSQIIFTFNRFTDLDPVFVRYVMNTPPNTLVLNVNYDELERAGLLNDTIKAEIEFDKANNPALYAYKWLGEPASQNEFSIINRLDILKAMQANIEAVGNYVCGVDVSRFGDDRTVFVLRKGLKTIKYHTIKQKFGIPQTCDLLEKFLEYKKQVVIKVDDTGVGGGVTDEMKKRGWQVYAINFGGKPSNKTKYPNFISEAWFHFGEIINQCQLPMDQDLLLELSTRMWKMDIKERRCVESKDEYKKRGYRSPDLADAFIICYSEKSTQANSGAVKPNGVEEVEPFVYRDGGEIQGPNFFSEMRTRRAKRVDNPEYM